MRKLYAVVLCATLAGCSRPSTPSAPVEPKSGTESALAIAVVVEPGLKELSFDQLSTPELSGTCNLEKIGEVLVPDEKPIMVPGRVFEVVGWLFDDSVRRAPEKLFLRFTAKKGGKVWEQQVAQTSDRPDVQATKGGSQELLQTGFTALIDASALPAGEYAVIMSYRRGEKTVVCDNGRAIVMN